MDVAGSNQRWEIPGKSRSCGFHWHLEVPKGTSTVKESLLPGLASVCDFEVALFVGPFYLNQSSKMSSISDVSDAFTHV